MYRACAEHADPLGYIADPDMASAVIGDLKACRLRVDLLRKTVPVILYVDDPRIRFFLRPDRYGTGAAAAFPGSVAYRIFHQRLDRLAGDPEVLRVDLIPDIQIRKAYLLDGQIQLQMLQFLLKGDHRLSGQVLIIVLEIS